MNSRVHILRIKTPEGVVFSQLLASPVTRAMAVCIDVLIIGAVNFILAWAALLGSIISPDFAGALILLLHFAMPIAYGILTEWAWRGQTIGKRLLRLRVVDAMGLRLQFHQIVVRNLLRGVDQLPVFYLLGGTVALLSSRGQRLGDIAANTIVIRSPKVTEPDLDQIMAGKFNSLRQHPHLVARLRQRVSPDEASVALQSLLRRETIEPSERVHLFRDIAAHFAQVVKFPPEATDGITDEQYVRNIVDVLYRTRAEAAADFAKTSEAAHV